MKKFIKVGSMALAVAMAVPAFAKDVEVEEEEGAVGWTPFALGVFSPVQLPWGSAKWDVFGIGVNLIWSDFPKCYGIGVGGVAMATRDDMAGIQASLLCNWASKDVYGIRAGLVNCSFGDAYGLEAAAFAYREGDFWGLDVNVLGNWYTKDLWGVGISGICNLNLNSQSYGWTCALGGNLAQTAYGLQTSLLFNYAKELHGCQIALVNYADNCEWGFQIGLVNIIMSNQLKVLPIVNGFF